MHDPRTFDQPSRSFSMDSLESRTFLSATPALHRPPTLASLAAAVTNPTVQADLKQLQTDTTKLRTDTRAARHALAADRTAINAELAKLRQSHPDLNTTVAPLRQQLKKDRVALRNALKDNNAAIRTTAKNGAKTLRLDRRVIRTARLAHDQSALTAAQAKFKADAAKLASDLTKLRNA